MAILMFLGSVKESRITSRITGLNERKQDMEKNEKIEKNGSGSNPVQPIVIRRELFGKMLEYWRKNL